MSLQDDINKAKEAYLTIKKHMADNGMCVAVDEGAFYIGLTPPSKKCSGVYYNKDMDYWYGDVVTIDELPESEATKLQNKAWKCGSWINEESLLEEYLKLVMSDVKIDCLAITNRIKPELLKENIDFIVELLEVDEETILEAAVWQLTEISINESINDIAFTIHEVELNLLIYFVYNVNTEKFKDVKIWKYTDPE